MNIDATNAGFSGAFKQSGIEALKFGILKGTKLPTNIDIFIPNSIPQTIQDIDVIQFYNNQVETQMGVPR